MGENGSGGHGGGNVGSDGQNGVKLLPKLKVFVPSSNLVIAINY